MLKQALAFEKMGVRILHPFFRVCEICARGLSSAALARRPRLFNAVYFADCTEKTPREESP